MSANNLVNAQRDEYFRQASNAAFFELPDEMPLVWLGRAKGGRINAMTYGPTLMHNFFEQTARHGYRHFFYGGKDGVAEQLKTVFESKFPGVKIVGTYCPPFRGLTAKENQEICQRINASSADIVWWA